MPEAAAKLKLVVITGRLHVGDPVRDEKKLLHAERYLARQARAITLASGSWSISTMSPI